MDMQMPVMDGLTATRKIREKESIKGGHLLIVAMTANVMQGDRERCLEAGMDGYIAKPINSEILKETIHNLINRNAKPALSNHSEPIIDTEAFFGRVIEDDRTIAQEIIKASLEGLPQMIENIRKAYESKEVDALRTAAHTLQSNASLFSAKAVADAALRLEQFAKQNNLESAESMVRLLEEETAKLLSELKKLKVFTTSSSKIAT